MIPWDDYRDHFGFLSGHKSPSQPESNAILFSSLERTLRKKLRTWTADDQDALARQIEVHCLSEEGRLIRPNPWSQDEEAPDDHIGLACSGCTYASQRVLDFFSSNPFYLGFFEFRFNAIIGQLRWCTGVKPDPIQRLWMAISIGLWPIDRKAQDPWVQNFLLVENSYPGWIEKWASNRFWKRLPVPLSEILSGYWSPEHPAVLACKELGI